MPYKSIESYGAIGNLCTTALVATSGCIDFMCFPEFDSPTVFAALLDAEKGGSFEISPAAGEFACKQMYVAETNILVTRFLSEDWVAELTDFMPVTATTQKSELVRTLKVIHGATAFRLCCRPAFDYARAQHRVEEKNKCHFVFHPIQSNAPPLRLRSTAELGVERDTVNATLHLREGQTATFILSGLDENREELDPKEAEKDLGNTLLYWRSWIGQSGYKGRWREAVNRSALALKLLTSREHGSLVAAATFGLPEHPGGTRNWDYRYVWMRDAAFSLYAFLRLGLRDESNDFFGWLRKVIHHVEDRQRSPIQIMYGLDGRRQLEEDELSHLSGYQDSKPVRIGNGAWNQLQLDIYGELLDAVYLYSKYGHPIPYDGWRRIIGILNWLGKNWNRKDEGIWEVRGGDKHFLHSRLMCWVAFDRAIRLANKRSLSAPLEEWFSNRDAIVEDIYANFWNDRLGAFVQHNGSEALDAAVLLMPLMRFISPLDPRWLSTLKAIEHSLAEGPFVYRYRHMESPDGMEGEEGSFTCCSFWLVECLARSNQVEKARQNFDKILAHANHLGLFSEELGRNGHQLGNYPQALTHLALISAATYLDRRLSGAAPEAWS